MLHVYIVKTELTGKLPEGTIYFQRPEKETHKMWGEDVVVPYDEFNVDGWIAAASKEHRIVSDGSGDVEGCYAKIRRLCGTEGKPIGTREVRSNLEKTYMEYVFKAILAKGVKRGDIGKMGRTVEEITTNGRDHGVSANKLKKCLAQAEKIAALLDENID